MSQAQPGSRWRDPEAASRLKASADLVGMVRSHGVELVSEGSDLVGLCPFHSETTPSFRVTPSKNLWHCFGCGKGGSAVDWIVETRGVSVREAFQSLSQGIPAPEPAERRGRLQEMDPSWSDGQLLSVVCEHYASGLAESPSARDYLACRGLWLPSLVERFRLGFADRTLGPSLETHPSRDALRDRLQSLGVFRDNGREHLYGSLVVPILSEPDGMGFCEPLGMYGRKVRSDLRAGTPIHLYLKGEHRGVFNATGIRLSGSDTVILCEALLDALTLIRWGLENTTSAYGVHGVGPDLFRFLTESGFKRVVIAYDADEAGDRAALALCPRLHAEGLEVLRMRLPAGQDVNSFANRTEDPAEELRLAYEGATWLSDSLYPSVLVGASELSESDGSDESPDPPVLRDVQKPPSSLAVQAPAVAVSAASAPAAAAPEPTGAPDPGVHEVTYGDRSWRVKGLSRNRTDDALRVTVRVMRQGVTGFHLDTLDLYQAKSREAFARAAGAELGVELEVCRADLARLVVSLEERLSALHSATRESTPAASVRTLSPEEREEALALLRRPDMLRQLLSDLCASGMVGEEENKLLCWLALTSRHLDSPLGVLIQSSSAAGKSSLLDGVLRTMPEEEVIRYSALSGQALFYMGGVSLKHKILCVAEEEGARRASYSLKLLQSDGELSMASTGKDPESGQLVTREYRTEGPVALALTTTSLAVDPELQNRCLVLCVDESREQTQAIHARQRQGQTREGQLYRRGVSERLSVWRNAQRLLRALDVVNPYAQELTFASHRTRTRRDMAKYLTLVNAVALAHQYQKSHRCDAHGEYVEVDLDDIELANRLAATGLGMGLCELSGPTERLWRTLRGWVQARAEKLGSDSTQVLFSRRDLSDCTPWSASQLKEHLRTLVEHEYLAVVRGKAGVSGSVQYRLCAWEEESIPSTVGTMDLERLRAAHPAAVYRGIWAYAPGGPEVGRGSAGSQNRPTPVVEENAREAHGDAVLPPMEMIDGARKSRSAGSAGLSRKGREKISVVVTDRAVLQGAASC